MPLIPYAHLSPAPARCFWWFAGWVTSSWGPAEACPSGATARPCPLAVHPWVRRVTASAGSCCPASGRAAKLRGGGAPPLSPSLRILLSCFRAPRRQVALSARLCLGSCKLCPSFECSGWGRKQHPTVACLRVLYCLSFVFFTLPSLSE